MKKIYHPPTLCRALIIIDSQPLKLEEQKKCQKIYQTLEKKRGIIQLHESQSLPKFKTWLQETFNEDLVHLRELQQKVNELNTIIDHVESQHTLTDENPKKIYEKLMNSKTEANTKTDDFFQSEFNNNENEFIDEEDDLQTMFESFFGTKQTWGSRKENYKECFEKFKTQFKDHQKNPRFEPSNMTFDMPELQTVDTRLKEYYRLLARRLHPDVNPNLNSEQLELWYQVQQAYQKKELSRLETLFALNEMLHHNLENIDGIATLKSLFQEININLKQVEKQIRLAKKDVSWKFHEKMDIPSELLKLEKLMKTDFKAHINQLKLSHKELQSIINRWSNKKKRKNY